MTGPVEKKNESVTRDKGTSVAPAPGSKPTPKPTKSGRDEAEKAHDNHSHLT